MTLSKAEYTYNGKEKKPTPTVVLNGVELEEGVDYTVKYGRNKNAGTATVRVTGTGNYTGSVTENFKIKKAKNAITASSVYASYSKKTRKVQIDATATAGKLTYTIASTDNSKVKINKTTGVVQLPAKFTGTVKIKIKATDEEGNYKNKTKTVSVTVLDTPSITSLTSNAAKKMTVKWGKISGATGYELQYTTAKKFSSGAESLTVEKTSKKVSKLTAGKTYRVRVRVYKTLKSGETVYSAWSDVMTVKIAK